MKPLSRHDRVVALVLFVVLSSVYFATTSGITSANDGSHYAFVRAMADDRSFEITPYLGFTEHLDYAIYGDHYYTDKPPGSALIVVPFYALGRIAPEPLAALPTKHDAGNPSMVYTLMGVALCAAAAATVLFITLRQIFDRSLEAAVVVSLAVGLGTTLWKYGSVLYQYAPGALVVMLSLYLALRADRMVRGFNRRPGLRLAFALGFLLGFMPVVDYIGGLFSLLVGLYLIATFYPSIRAVWHDASERGKWLNWWALFVLGGLLPIAFLLIYNTLNFGGPLRLSTFQVDITKWPKNESIGSYFAGSLLLGLRANLFFDPPSENQGLFWLAPVALFSLAGLQAMFRHDWRKATLVITAFAFTLLVLSGKSIYSETNDSRYITSFLGLWFIPAAFWYDEGYALAGHPFRLLWEFAFYGLLLLSIRNQFMHIAFSWNYTLNPAWLRPLAVSPQNIALLFGTVFRNAPNLPLLWGVQGAIAVLCLLARRLRGIRTAHQT